MSIHDPISDFLTRIRNALMAKHESVTVPYTRLKEAMSEIIKQEGLIRDVSVVGEGVGKNIVILLKYMASGEPMITGMERVSKLGRRVYVGRDDLKPMRQGLGIAILSTPKGVMKDTDAQKAGVGGELLCTLW